MIVWIREWVTAILWDEAAAQRFLAATCFLLGNMLSHGGTVPGTTIVIPGIEHLYVLGPYLQAVGTFLGAGSMLPSRPNGGGETK